MKIEPGRAVTLAFDLCDEKGEIIEASDITGAIAFIHGRGAIIPGLDKRLLGMKVGDEANFSFPPEEAFGTIDQAPTKRIGRGEFPKGVDLRKGVEFEAGMPGGQKIRLVIDEVGETEIVVRMVHPLAGQIVTMSVKVQQVREATPQELASGKVITRPPKPPPTA